MLTETHNVASIQEQIWPLTWRDQVMHDPSAITTLLALNDPLADWVPVQYVDREPVPRCAVIELVYRVVLFPEAVAISACRLSA